MRPPSFDLFARHYDQTRTLHPNASAAAFRFISRRYPPERYPRALELGIGTGRIAFPMARTGYRVVGVDLSRRMLGRLQARPREGSTPRPQAVRADATRLPFRDGSFDLVYWVHVLHLVPRWRRALDEAVRVLRRKGVLMALRTEGGRDIREISDRYDSLTRRLGARRRTAGVRSLAAVARQLRRRGLKLRPNRAHWSWTEPVSIRETLRFLGLRVYSSMRSVPVRAHRIAMRELRAWARKRYGDLSTTRPVRGDIRIHEAVNLRSEPSKGRSIRTRSRAGRESRTATRARGRGARRRGVRPRRSA